MARAHRGACTQRRVHTEVQVAIGGAREPFVKGHPSVDPLMPCLADPMCAQRHGWRGTMHPKARAHRGAPSAERTEAQTKTDVHRGTVRAVTPRDSKTDVHRGTRQASQGFAYVAGV